MEDDDEGLGAIEFSDREDSEEEEVGSQASSGGIEVTGEQQKRFDALVSKARTQTAFLRQAKQIQVEEPYVERKRGRQAQARCRIAAAAKPMGYTAATLRERVSRCEGENFDVHTDTLAVKGRFLPHAPTSHGMYSEPTSLCCMWCTEPCDCVPVPLPDYYVKRTDQFKVSGIFCSFNCMLSESVRVLGNTSIARMCMKRVYGISQFAHVARAPSPHCLLKFGGAMTIQQFRATSLMGIRTETISPPFIPAMCGTQETEKVVLTVTETLGAREVIHVVQDAVSNRRISNGRIYIRKSRKTPRTVSPPVNPPTIQEQIAMSEERTRRQVHSIGLDSAKRKVKTLRDFMHKKST